ncbi:hypothetical protein BD289DRAFT_447790 [Coniella lustricola]|uniref:Uncharacterized protein n=1 Tax=Coniella lustricola TaxID=2025994 RepID=A0A2T2ZSS0_9PEZI|nr:hypothetical protein BD289DRAFT_447790 [Coniella lustricola]
MLFGSSSSSSTSSSASSLPHVAVNVCNWCELLTAHEPRRPSPHHSLAGPALGLTTTEPETLAMPSIPYLPRLSALTDYLTNQVDYTPHPLHILALIGILAVLHHVERALDLFSFHFRASTLSSSSSSSLFRPAALLQVYKRRGPKPTYALVAGDGALGLGVARALLARGFGVIVLTRSGDGGGNEAVETTKRELREVLRLQRTAEAEAKATDEAEEDTTTTTTTTIIDDDDNDALLDEYIHVLPLDAATATPDEMEAALRSAIVDGNLRVSILVNAGQPHASPAAAAPAAAVGPAGPLSTLAPDEIDTVLARETRFITRLTALMMPVLAHRGAGVDAKGMSFGTHRRSLVLNIVESESGSEQEDEEEQGSGVVHRGVAAFRRAFTQALAREVAREEGLGHIDVLGAVVAGHGAKKEDDQALGDLVVRKTDSAVGRGWNEMYPEWRLQMRVVVRELLGEDRARKWFGKKKQKQKKPRMGEAEESKE